MPLSVQDQLTDAVTRHQVGLLRVAAGIRRLIAKALDESETTLRMRIVSRLARHTGTLSPANEVRVRNLFREVEKIRGAAWAKAFPIWRDKLIEVAVKEPALMEGILRTVSPTKLQRLRKPSTRALEALVSKRPFQGRVLARWAKDIELADVRRIKDQIRIGLIRGDSPTAISKRIVGTARFRGSNGVLQITRNHANTITRTATTHFANAARREFFLENPDIVKQEMYVAVLDERTTETCISLNGKIRKVGVLPVPPLHFWCRSNLSAVANDKALASGRQKPLVEQLMLREFASEHGLTGITSRAGLPRGFKGTFDTFSKQRLRELIGPAPTDPSGELWLRRQSAKFQSDNLGPTRAKLFRRAGVSARELIPRLGDPPIPLRQLARAHADWFKAAGLDPEDFL